jgi:putative spermidine/putrescine transport system substrate-binding protein
MGMTMMRMASKAATLAATAVLSLLAAGPVLAEELRILSWQGYADDDWVEAFEKETGADVSVVFIGTDDEIWAKIKGSEGKDFDLFAVNTAQLQRYIDAGLATPYDLDALPAQKEVLQRFRDLETVGGTMRDGKVYGVPFAFDTIGLIYDTTKVSTPPTSWEVLYDGTYAGRVLGYDNGEHNVSIAALDLGIENPFRLDDAQFGQVKEKLTAMKGNLLSLYSTADEALQLYQQNDVAVIFANFGQQQVKMMKDAGAPIAYVNPKEGALAWLDTWAMTSGVQNKELAEKWVNFVLSKEIGQALSDRTGFGNTSVPFPSAGESDKIVWLESVEDPTRRADLWNEIKAAP